MIAVVGTTDGPATGIAIATGTPPTVAIGVAVAVAIGIAVAVAIGIAVAVAIGTAVAETDSPAAVIPPHVAAGPALNVLAALFLCCSLMQ